MKTLYLECNSGISGDMTVAALLDLGGDQAVLRRGLESLGVTGYHLHIGRVSKCGIAACDFHVHLEAGDPHGHTPEEVEGHTHPAHGHDHEHAHDHHHPSEGGHGHAHNHGEDTHSHTHPHSHKGSGHTHGHHSHTHDHRNLADILALIEAAPALTPGAKELAGRIFRVVAEAEARVHGLPLDQVHFHEVGAVDSIVDIVGAAILVDNLSPHRILCSPLREGQGTVRCQHGVMPVPAPATLEILRGNRVPYLITQNQGEMVTPTGAAIAAALADGFCPPPPAVVTAVGYGAGKKDFAVANLLRASLLEEQTDTADQVVKLECNLDDMTGEHLAYACELLLEAGALDVWCTPIYMKKSRPAQMLSVLCTPALEPELVELLFAHTSTLGLRRSTHTRHTMERRRSTRSTPWGEVEVKEARRGEICKTKVEHESAAALAKPGKIPINQISKAAYDE